MGKDFNYNQIYLIWKNERQLKGLLEVKSNLYSSIRQKITKLETELEKIDKKDEISFKIVEARISRLKQILNDLSKIRTHKVIHSLLGNEITSDEIAAEEMGLVKNLKRIFDDHNQRSILGKNVLDTATPETKNPILQEITDAELMTVRILEDIPEIVDASAKGKTKQSFGPFKKEDVVRLPMVYAKTLIMKNAADRIDLPDL
ncbi:MAG: DNA replication complex subunit Gins51 [Candidatus Heimdallarchaeota archaeon]